jgi:hypothetical protein
VLREVWDACEWDADGGTGTDVAGKAPIASAAARPAARHAASAAVSIVADSDVAAGGAFDVQARAPPVGFELPFALGTPVTAPDDNESSSPALGINALKSWTISWAIFQQKQQQEQLRRQQELEDENINLKIRMRHMEEVVSALREHAASGQEKDSGLRAEMTALACETEQKQSELLQARREIVRVEAQLDQSRRHIDAAEAEASSMRAQLSSARALNEKYLSLKGDLWPLLANDATFVDRQNGASGREKAGRGENSDQQLVCGLRKMREAYDRELERAFFLDSARNI